MTHSADNPLAIELADPSATYETLAEFDSALATQRHRAHSQDRAVEATVDGQGRLVDLKIDDRALRSAHPQLIGPAIVEAIAASRAEASKAAQEELPKHFQLDQGMPQPGDATGLHPAAERSSTQESRRAPQQDAFDEDEDPLFQGLDAEQGNHW